MRQEGSPCSACNELRKLGRCGARRAGMKWLERLGDEALIAFIKIRERNLDAGKLIQLLGLQCLDTPSTQTSVGIVPVAVGGERNNQNVKMVQMLPNRQHHTHNEISYHHEVNTRHASFRSFELEQGGWWGEASRRDGIGKVGRRKVD
ncbi:hypothetical protein BDK51DRAFT_26619 [Blyttiomyces helicus]|uniref:Uncharacterized protein n=1 Tax=Blyttiomyces helicus TaxID=388810 RepID=A0A4P9W3Z9_9FUNG|nr:hypothetical protein BDK51DRAFT_26619 [Blyttiomyces helicus]|eukprot:RKO87061.1 hypothetical protein BDK51DRAFT_26619 [Blyttiomyces helicus]